MKPRFATDGIQKTRPSEYVVRFLFGGGITACASLASHAWGPVVGGLFLGFPAILPASLILVRQHDGRQAAIDDARGGWIGSVGLVAFAAVVWAGARSWSPFVVLAVATALWLTVDVLSWAVFFSGRKGK